MENLFQHPIEQKRYEIVAEFLKSRISTNCAMTPLTPAERTEVLRLARGLGAKEAACEAGVSHETIRARRKRIYRKLNVGGQTALQQELLALAVAKLVPAQAETVGAGA